MSHHLQQALPDCTEHPGQSPGTRHPRGLKVSVLREPEADSTPHALGQALTSGPQFLHLHKEGRSMHYMEHALTRKAPASPQLSTGARAPPALAGSAPAAGAGPARITVPPACSLREESH